MDAQQKYDQLLEQRREASRKYMAKVSKTPEFIAKRKQYYQDNIERMRERSRVNYKKYYNSDKKKDYYDKNRYIINCKSQYKYYQKKEQVEKFKEKYPDKFKDLVEINYITI